MNETKRCTQCGEIKPLEGFYKDGRNKHGLTSWCKACSHQYKHKRYQALSPLERAIKVMASNLCNRARRNQGVYANVENHIGSETEIRDYLRAHFSQDIQALLDSGETPSVDRLGDHYERGTIRVISQRENSRLGGETAGRELAHPIKLVYNDGAITMADSIADVARYLNLRHERVRSWYKRGFCQSRGIVKIERIKASEIVEGVRGLGQ